MATDLGHLGDVCETNDYDYFTLLTLKICNFNHDWSVRSSKSCLKYIN